MAACVDYNLACFYDALAEVESDPNAKAQLLDECCRHLELAAPVESPTKELLLGDLASEGDLANFAASVSHGERLQKIITAYETAWSAAPETLITIL
jgi:hypothetical protein